MTPRALNSLAVAGLALAIALLGLSLASGLQRERHHRARGAGA